jgi:hypothetical protein
MFMDGPPEVKPMEDSLAFPDWQEADLPSPKVRPFKSKFKAIFLDDLDKGGIEHAFIVDDWYSEGDVSVVGGKSGSGKTFYILNLVMSLVYGVDFFGSHVEQGFVLYQAGEGQSGVKKRLRAWHQHFGVAHSRKSPFAFLQAPVDLYRDDSDVNALIEEALGLAEQYPGVPRRMIVIDTLATASPGADENTVRDMGPVLARGAKLAAATGMHVLFAHHGDGKLRGSTSIYAAVGQVVLITEDPATKIKTALLDKQKDGERGLSVQFELMQVHLGETARGKPVTSCVCLALGEKEAIRRSEEHRGFALRDDEREFMRVFFDVDRTLGLAVPSDMRVPAAVRSIVRIADFRDELERQTPPLDIPADTSSADERAASKTKHADRIKKHVKRMGEKLKGFGVIGNGQHGDVWWMWWTGKPLRAFPRTSPQEEIPDTSPEGPAF